MIRTTALTSVLGLAAGGALAQGEMNFNRIASFPVIENMAEGEDRSRESAPEIIAATPDGMTLVYTDSPLGAIGLIDIATPASPAPLGTVTLDGEPTAVAVVGRRAYVGINTSQSYTEPSGALAVIDIDTRQEVARCDLGGQPDSVAANATGSLIAIAIENERDEDAGDGRVPQMPPGSLAMIDLADNTAQCETLRFADLTGLAAVAPEDPEPEFVHINGLDETVVTLQENNHMVVVARDGTVVSHFSAGAVDLDGIDTEEEGALVFTDSQPGVVREPDAVTWIDDEHFATANEGDMDGGSRGFTIFNKDGNVVFESGTSFEEALIQIGHYPEERSGNKGVEPESVTTGIFGGTPMLFVGSERGSVVGVYDITDPASPVLAQLLPSGIGPEGYVTIPERNLLISANEYDGLEDGAARAHVMIFEYQEAPASYPHLTSAGMDALTGWGAISGMAAVDDSTIVAVNDSFYGMQPTIFSIDVSQTPAQITAATRVTRNGAPAQKLDLEGIALDGEGGYWLASEGRTDRVIPHALYRVNAEGEIEEEIGLPPELMATERRFGFEGVALIDDTLWMAVQREWDDDPAHHAKLVSYNLQTEEWGAVHYPKAAPQTGWVGLSEITANGDHVYIVERDNQHGSAAVTKKIYRVPMADLAPAAIDGDDPLPVVTKQEVRDLISDLTSTGGYVLDKVEGLAITPNGMMWVSTDNDGVDDHSGETMLFAVPTPES